MTTSAKNHFSPFRRSFGYAEYIRCGQEAVDTIRAVQKGGYKEARRHTAFYSQKRWQDSQARRMVSVVGKIGALPDPYFFENGMLYVLSLWSTIEKGRVVYIPAKGYEKGQPRKTKGNWKR